MGTSKRVAAIITASLLIFSCLIFTGCPSSTGDETTIAPPVGQPPDLKEPPPGTSIKLTILHTNDTHGQAMPLANNDHGGLARISWAAKAIRAINAARGAHTLMLDAGDVRDGTSVNDATDTKAMWSTMALIGYDAIIPGNHDHLEGLRTLYYNLTDAFGIDTGVPTPVYNQHTKVLYGNINPDRINVFPAEFVTMESQVKDSFENAFVDPLPPGAGQDAWDASLYPSDIDIARMTPMYDDTSKLFNQTIFYNLDGLVVGIFGAANTEVIYTFLPSEPLALAGVVLPAGVEGEGGIFYPTDPLDGNYTNQMIDYLADPNGDGDQSDGADIIICLSHSGTGTDMDIARYARGPKTGRYVDLVVGGHSHDQINRAVEIVHPIDGRKSWVVQAKNSGEFLGRVDLDIVNGVPRVVNSGLIEIDNSIPRDPVVADYLQNEITKPGGVDDWFLNTPPDVGFQPYGVKPSDTIGWSDVTFKTEDFSGENPLTNLIANAFLWQGRANSIFNYPSGDPSHTPGDPGYTDFALLIPFVLHAEGALKAGPVSAEDVLDTLHLHDITPDPSRPDTMNIIGLKPMVPMNLDLGGTSVTLSNSVEAFLEVLYGIVDLMDALGAILPPEYVDQLATYSGALQEYLGTLQWAGISFEVDFSRPPLDRINPNSILINGQAVDPARVYYFSMNSTIAKFINAIGALLSGLGLDFIVWDPAMSETYMPEWVALMNYIDYGLPNSTITKDMVAVSGSTLRTIGPDLTLQPWDITFWPPSPARGETVNIREWILNTGRTGVADADIDFTYDPTPTKMGDNPDGFTDIITGYNFRYIGRDHVRDVPGYTNRVGAALSDGLDWTVPYDLAPGNYEICPNIRNLVASRPEKFTGNNRGKGLCATLTIR